MNKHPCLSTKEAKWVYALKHEFIADIDAHNMIYAIRLYHVDNRLLLLVVFSAIVVWEVVVAQPDRHVHFRLLNCLKLSTGQCLIRLKYLIEGLPQAPTGCNRSRRDGDAVKHMWVGQARKYKRER